MSVFDDVRTDRVSAVIEEVAEEEGISRAAIVDQFEMRLTARGREESTNKEYTKKVTESYASRSPRSSRRRTSTST